MQLSILEHQHNPASQLWPHNNKAEIGEKLMGDDTLHKQIALDELCQHHVVGTTPTSLKVKVWEQGLGFSIWLCMMSMSTPSTDSFSKAELCGIVCLPTTDFIQSFRAASRDDGCGPSSE